MISPLRHVVMSRRAILLAGLAGIIALSWVHLVWMERAMYGPDASCPMHTTPDWTLDYAAMTFLMWVVMMIAMMLPSTAPMVIAVETIARTRGRPPSLPWIFLAGYIAVWSGFSAGATAVQWMFHRLAVLAPMDLAVTPVLGGVLLTAAGVYQWMPYKQSCLQRCSPLAFLLQEWREGPAGAFLMGLRHGAFCVGCCAALMLLLFVAGVMNLLWIATLAAVVLVEKLAGPRPRLNSILALLLVFAGLGLSLEALWRT
jgi:predicted metal-binding membrane protein